MYMYLYVIQNILDLGIDTNLKIAPKRLKNMWIFVFVSIASNDNWEQSPILRANFLVSISLGLNWGQGNIPIPTWFEYSYLSKS